MNKDVQGEIIRRGSKETHGIHNPFPGLRPFGIDETHLFFGREGQGDEVLIKLSQNKFVGILGASGSGKSSFVLCGVIPILYGGFLADKGTKWTTIITKPGNAPIDNLATSLLENDNSYRNSGSEGKKIKKTIVNSLLRSNSLGLVEAIYQTKEIHDTNFLVLIDQFEELFRFKKSADGFATINESLAFVDLLMEATKFKDAKIYVAITMRSDFIGECAQFPDLTKAINDSHYLIPQMTREQKRLAITGPVAVGGGNISTRLTQKLLNDLGDNPDQLPILQHALMRTWTYWTQQANKGEALDLAHYDAIGGMEQALSEHADEAYNELTDNQKKICESVFKSLTEKDSDNQGIRTPTSLKEISEIAQVSEAEVIAVIDKFRAIGRSLLTPGAGTKLTSDSIIDISHESLMRIWKRLKDWLDEEGEALKMYLKLSESARLQQEGKAGLWRPPDLQIALTWREAFNPSPVWAQKYDDAFERTMTFLNYSSSEYDTEQKIKEMLQKRALKRARLVSIILGVLVIVAVGFLVFAIVQNIEADKQAIEARNQQIIAEKRTIEAENSRKNALTQQQIANSERSFADVARERAEKEGQNARISEASAKEQRSKAEINALEAIKQKNIAQGQYTLAQIRRQEAEAQKKIADKERENAYNLRLLSIAQSMAVKSVQLTDTSLKGAVAEQAYKFNASNGGDPYHPDIYDGLYYATKLIEGEKYNVLTGHTNPVRSIVTSNFADIMFSTGSDGQVLQWATNNTKKGGAVLIKNSTSDGSNLVNRALALTRDNKLLACGGEFPYIQLFNLKEPEAKPLLIKGIVGAVWFLGFTSNNKNLIISSSEHQILRWDFNNVTEVLKSVPKITSMCVSPKSNKVMYGNEIGQIFSVDIDNRNEQTLLYADKNKKSVYSVVFNASGSLLAAGDEDGIVRIFDLIEGKLQNVLTRHRSRVNDIKFSPDGRHLGTASWDGTVRLWNFSKLNNQPIDLKDHGKEWVWAIAFSADSKKIFAACKDNQIRIWPTNSNQFSDKICDKLKKNMSKNEWEQFVAPDIPYEFTCPRLPKGETPIDK